MLDLTFFTSNPVKLAHARYLAEGLPVRIVGFHEKTYHATYDEPRLSERKELLEASYRSAVKQGTKAGILSKRHFFMLEDTSATIDALSTPEREVPGLDIKYWMQDATFASLDASLRARGNNRRARVRSDIVLHVPDDYKHRWGIEDDYLVFVGEQEGTIVDQEVSFATNLIFPWLDNSSFNKWFVPEGADAPLGQLTVGDARQFDFRAKSFGKLFEFLRSKGLLRQELVQQSLSFSSERNFIVCGYTCAGKTTASQFLANRFDYLHVEASDFMYLSYYARHNFKNDVSIGDFAEQALVQKPEIAAEKIAEFLREESNAPAVVSGFRSPAEITWLKNHFAASGREFEVIFVDADDETRFHRMTLRKRGGDVHSEEKFRSRDEQQRRMGLSEIARDAAVTHWPNDGTIAAYYKLIRTAVGRRPFVAPNLGASIEEIRKSPRIGLEDAILVTLLSRWTSDENRDYFTTAEIAKMTGDVLGSGSRKHKDNVSRYFNQYFYAFYEIASDDRGTRRYRLSNTGYGKALRTLRMIARNAPGM